MVKINSKTISEPVSKVIKKIETPVTEHTENTRAIADNLTARANSAIAGISLPKLSVKSVLEKHTKFLETIKHSEEDGYSKIGEYITSLNDNSRELQDIDDLITLVGKEKLNQKVLRFLDKDSHIPQVISDDLEKMRETNKSLIDIFVPEFATKEEALKNTKLGDVFHLKDKKYIQINTENGSETLNMDKKTYFKLFPPVERYANVQDGLGNCYEITALNSMMQNPKTRANFLKVFEQNGNDDIIIKLPNGSLKNGVRIPNGELTQTPELKNNDDELKYYSVGCEGFQLVEYALGKDLKNEFLNYHLEKLRTKKKENNPYKLSLNKIEKAIEKNNSKELAKIFGADNQRTLETNLRESNFATMVWSKFGYKNNEFLYKIEVEEDKNFEKAIDDWSYLKHHFNEDTPANDELFMDTLLDKNYFKNHLVECSILSSKEKTVDGLTTGHSMRLTPTYDKNDKINGFLITDPYSIAPKKLSDDETFNVIDTLTSVKI